MAVLGFAAGAWYFGCCGNRKGRRRGQKHLDGSYLLGGINDGTDPLLSDADRAARVLDARRTFAERSRTLNAPLHVTQL